MKGVPQLFGLVLLALTMLVGVGATQDKKEEKKAKGQLPAGFKDLNLTAEQKVGIYKILGEFRPKISDLEKQIKDLKKTEQQEMFRVLTEDQKKKYLESKGIETKAKAAETKDKAKVTETKDKAKVIENKDKN